MQAIILAAGMGRRLGKLTQDNTKCMLEVNGYRLIDRTCDSLVKAGINRIIIVIGYKGENLINYLGNNFKNIEIIYIKNPLFDRTNNIYSLFLAREFLIDDDTILLESDIIFESQIIQYLVDYPYANLALVDKYKNWMDGTVVTLDQDNSIVSFVNRKQFDYSKIDQYYKTVNIYKFSRDFSISYYVPFLTAYSQALGNEEYYEQVLKVITLLDNSPLRALPLNGEKWYEIDDIQDLDIASAIFLENREEKYNTITSRYGGYWRYPGMLDFCYLVNPFFPPKSMIKELINSFEYLMRDYPSGMKVNSMLAAKNFSISDENIVIGNGATELIKSLIENYSGKLGVIMPTFEEYVNRNKANNHICYIPDNADFSYTVKDIIEFFLDKPIDTLLLINPDNPSGNYINYYDLIYLIEWCKTKRVNIIIDESFVDFADVKGEYTLIKDSILQKYPHLFVIKSISKSYGVPGFRIGVLSSGNKEIIQNIKKDVAIWNINSFGEYFMQIYEKYHNEYLKACATFKEERIRFYNALKNIPFLRVIPSQANYFLCEVVTNKFTSKELAIELLDKYNILIKDCSGKLAFKSKNYIRLAIRDEVDNQLLINALTELI